MAKGSLQPLGRYLHMSVPVTVRPPYYTGSGKKRRLQRPPNRIAEGNTKQGFEIRDDIGLGGMLRFSFNFENLVEYFGLNDKIPNDRIPSTPWQVLAEANTNMIDFVNSEIQSKLPNISDYLEFV
jgi:hypothetical protein